MTLRNFAELSLNYRENGAKVRTKYRRYFVESSREQLTKFVEVRSYYFCTVLYTLALSTFCLFIFTAIPTAMKMGLVNVDRA